MDIQIKKSCQFNSSIQFLQFSQSSNENFPKFFLNELYENNSNSSTLHHFFQLSRIIILYILLKNKFKNCLFFSNFEKFQKFNFFLSIAMIDSTYPLSSSPSPPSPTFSSQGTFRSQPTGVAWGASPTRRCPATAWSGRGPSSSTPPAGRVGHPS